MTSLDRIIEMDKHLATACAELDNVRGYVQEIVDDPFVAAADPILIEAQQEASTALKHAEAAAAHLDRLRNRIFGHTDERKLIEAAA